MSPRALPAALFCLLFAVPSVPASAVGARAAGFTAAAGKVDITPDLAREHVLLAGYGAKGRRAAGVRDPLYARAAALSDGERTVVLLSLDSLGLFREDVLELRRRLGLEDGRRFLFVTATHDHSAPDLLGLWGPLPGVRARANDRYRERVLALCEGLVRGLLARLEPVELVAARSELDPRGLCGDLRDPAVLDPELGVLRLRAKDGRALATVVRWSCHAEALGRDNLRVTADYPGALCGRVEALGGGTCVFLPGAMGGLLSPDVDRRGGLEKAYAESDRVGESVAAAALAALKRGETAASGRVDFSTRTLLLAVDNSRYLLFLPALARGHRLFEADGRPLRRAPWRLALRHLLLFPLPERLRPRLESEVSLVRLGPVAILGLPGEPFPELVLGGYDGALAFGAPLIRPENPAPPALEKAPEGPYLRSRLPRHGWVVGLAGDELGYFVPDYDFRATPTRSMLPRPKGGHYEETNSLGRRASDAVLSAAGELLTPRAPARRGPM
ncbi:MAG: hypothetical protein WC969_02390 [Elusimicrobiota bacterium]|jgi:hypothetical protein